MKIQAIDDGKIERGHICICAGCGDRGVFCDTDAGEIIGGDGRPVSVELDGLEVLMAGTTSGQRCDEVFCEVCADC